MRVLVGLSGGVDSSCAALILKNQGYEVVGTTMAIWGKAGVYKKIREKIAEYSKSSHGACLGPNEKEDIKEAEHIAKQIGIDFYVFDCAKQYEKIVLENFKQEYLSGHTPNPCILCNALIKFDLLPKLAKENGIKFDKFATGHYARVEKNNKGDYVLKKGIDEKKDQSYFLYRLKQEQLKDILLPLGNYTKAEIREFAKQMNLSVAEKPDSQDFYEGDYNELLQIEEREGNIVDIKGNILGRHKGFWNYTIGQRKGLNISYSEPLYVIELKADTNEVVVGEKDKTMQNILYANNLNLFEKEKFDKTFECFAKIRSGQNLQKVFVTRLEKDLIKVEFENMQKSIALGQSVVLYDGDTLIGGGIIERTGD